MHPPFGLKVVRAEPGDADAVRDLFGRQLPHGERIYDSWRPYYGLLPGSDGLPDFEVWVVRHRGQVVGASWYEVTDPGQIRVVVLTDTAFEYLAAPLLAKVEDVIRGDGGKAHFSHENVRAWLPKSPLIMDMERVYESSGWTLATQWYIDLTTVHTRRDELILTVAAARRKGIYILPYDPDFDVLPEHPFLDTLHSSGNEILIAHQNGVAVAANGVYVDPGERRVAFVEPVIYRVCDSMQMATDALVASLLLIELSRPQLLVGLTPLGRYQLCFRSFTQEAIPQYRLTKEFVRSTILLPYPGALVK